MAFEFEYETIRKDIAKMDNASSSAKSLLQALASKLDAAVTNASTLPDLRAQVSQISSGMKSRAGDFASAVVENSRYRDVTAAELAAEIAAKNRP